MAEIDYLGDEIERMRVQVGRERREIRAAINSLAAEAALSRMLGKIDDACAEGERLREETPREDGQDRLFGKGRYCLD